jgi:hypothetical protein
MPNKAGSYDDIRFAVWTTIPTILMLFIGVLKADTTLGKWSFIIGIVFLFASIVLAFIGVFKKPKGCDGCIYNTDEKFLKRFKK